MPRPGKYEAYVKPYLDEIAKMAENMTEAQIASALGVSVSAWKAYKKQFPAVELSLKKGRQNLVSDLRSALIERAKGYEYKETKVVTEQMKLPDYVQAQLIELGIDLEDVVGKVRLVRTEVSRKHQPADVAALNLALKNYDKENWANDPQSLALKKEELALKKKQIENNQW